MKLHAVFILLTLAGCATVSSPRSRDAEPVAGSAGPAGDAGEAAEPVRLETPAGTFLVHPNNAEDFARLLAGEPTQQQYLSVTDAP